MAGAGYDIGASLAASSSATSGNTGAFQLGGGGVGTKTDIAALLVLVAALMGAAMLIYFLFKGAK